MKTCAFGMVFAKLSFFGVVVFSFLFLYVVLKRGGGSS